MSEQPATYTCDECGYQAGELALVVAHLRTEHGITDPAEVGSVTQQAGRLILRSGDRETIIDLDAWVREHLAESQPAYAIGQPFDFTEGERVICNGYPGTIDRVLTGQLAGMVEVRLARGFVCVSACYPDCYPAPSDGMKLS